MIKCYMNNLNQCNKLSDGTCYFCQDHCPFNECEDHHE